MRKSHLDIMGQQCPSKRFKTMQLDCGSEHKHLANTHSFAASMYGKKHRTQVREMQKIGKLVNTHFDPACCQLHTQVGDTIDGKVVISHVGSAMRT